MQIPQGKPVPAAQEQAEEQSEALTCPHCGQELTPGDVAQLVTKMAQTLQAEEQEEGADADDSGKPSMLDAVSQGLGFGKK